MGVYTIPTHESAVVERKILEIIGVRPDRFAIAFPEATGDEDHVLVLFVDALGRPFARLTVIDRRTKREHVVHLTEHAKLAIVDIVNTHLQALADRKHHT